MTERKQSDVLQMASQGETKPKACVARSLGFLLNYQKQSLPQSTADETSDESVTSLLVKCATPFYETRIGIENEGKPALPFPHTTWCWAGAGGEGGGLNPY